jgi:exodeoxyribonuclease V alpha subunit
MTLLTSTTLSAKVEKIIFENPQNGYAVLSVQPQDKTLGKVIVVGTFVSALVGEDVLFQGEWQKHPQHGQQFCAQSCELLKRDTAHAAQRLLVHNLDGIGPSYAKKLHQAFGENLVEILDKKPERLKEVSGIGKARYQKIVQSWQKHKASHETMLFLTSHRLGYAIATKIYKKYGEHTITKIQQNPYQLTEEIEGVGFHTADNIARSLDIDKDAPQRLAAGILYVLQQATKYGHCGIAQSALLEQSATLLGCTKDLLSPLLEDMHQNKKIIIDEVKEVPCVFLPQLWYQEINIAKKLKKMLAKPPSNTASLLKILEEELEKEALSLSKEQHEAIHQALQSNVFILTGGPGVGKTTLVRLLANLFTRRALT